MVFQQVVNSRDLDYSHFVSLPLAFNPELINKLYDFQNTVLGMAASDKDKNLEIDAETSSTLTGIEIYVLIKDLKRITFLTLYYAPTPTINKNEI